MVMQIKKIINFDFAKTFPIKIENSISIIVHRNYNMQIVHLIILFECEHITIYYTMDNNK